MCRSGGSNHTITTTAGPSSSTMPYMDAPPGHSPLRDMVGTLRSELDDRELRLAAALEEAETERRRAEEMQRRLLDQVGYLFYDILVFKGVEFLYGFYTKSSKIYRRVIYLNSINDVCFLFLCLFRLWSWMICKTERCLYGNNYKWLLMVNVQLNKRPKLLKML